VAGFCECGEEPSGSCATELVGVSYRPIRKFPPGVKSGQGVTLTTYPI
jgi:hypothetical protein